MSNTRQIKCSNCGSTRDAHEIFCGNCGERIVSTMIQGDNATTKLKSPGIFLPTSVHSKTTMVDQNQTVLELSLASKKQKPKLASYYHIIGLKRTIILVASIFSLTLLLISFAQNNSSLFTQIAILLAVGLFVYIITQIAILEQWYWFIGFLLANPMVGSVYYLIETTSSTRWFWLVANLIASPIIGFVYSLIGPTEKRNYAITVTAQKHLILITAITGIALVIVAIFFNIHWAIYLGAEFIFAGNVLTFIHLLQLRQMEWLFNFLIFSGFLAFIPFPFLGIAYILFGPEVEQE